MPMRQKTSILRLKWGYSYTRTEWLAFFKRRPYGEHIDWSSPKVPEEEHLSRPTLTTTPIKHEMHFDNNSFMPKEVSGTLSANSDKPVGFLGNAVHEGKTNRHLENVPRALSISVGETISFQLGDQPSVVNGHSSSMYSEIMFGVIQRATIRVSERIPNPLEVNPVSRTVERNVVIQSCAAATKPDMRPQTHKRRTYLHAFEGHPRFSSSRLIASSGADPERNSTECQESAKVEISEEALHHTFLVLSRETQFGGANVAISSHFRSVNEITSSGRQPWHATAFSFFQMKNPPKPQRTLEMIYVYVLSSVPYFEHEEFKGISFDKSAMKVLFPAHFKKGIGALCDFKGTEIVAAIVGRNLGAAFRKTTTIVPVPTQTCELNPTRDTFFNSLVWVRHHLSKTGRKGAIVILDHTSVTSGVLTDHLARQEMESIKELGALILIPGSSCTLKGGAYLTVGPYGQRLPKGYMIPFMNYYCQVAFDVFAPGLNVVGASYFGPLAYRKKKLSSEIAVGSFAGILSDLLYNLDHLIKLDDLKTMLVTKIQSIRPELENGSRAGVAMVLVGSRTSLVALNMSLFSFYSDSPRNEVKPNTVSAPKIPVSMIFGICGAVGALVVIVTVGGAFFYVRRFYQSDDDDSDFTDASSVLELRRNDQEEPADRELPEQPLPDRTLPVNSLTEVGMPVELDETATADVSYSDAGDRPKESQPARKQVMQRFLSLRKGTESPITKSSKASWFATPKRAPKGQHIVFSQEHGVYEDSSINHDTTNSNTARDREDENASCEVPSLQTASTKLS